MHTMRTLNAIGLAITAAALLGCETTPQHSHDHATTAPGHAMGAPMRAVAVLEPTAKYSAQGVVEFEQTGSQVTVTAHVWNLPPGSTHAWHIHEFGDIRADDGTATGGHYNPEGHDHGLPSQSDRHAGDLGNLQSDVRGHARKVVTVDNCSIAGRRNPIIGRAVIVHVKADDGGQPTGNAGARIAQGVIGVAK